MPASIVGLPPDIDFPLLSSCGVPRCNFLARTHRPQDTLDATKAFDAEILDTFCAIAGIEKESLSTEQRLLIHLPASQGGMGITCYEKILDCAYEASTNPEGDAQDARTSIINKKIFDDLKAKKYFSNHIDLCAGRHASSWLFATDVVCKDPLGFKGALQQRIRYVPKTKKTTVHCVCGFVGKPADIEAHAPGCKGEKSNDLTARHEAVQQVLVEIAREAGVSYTLAPSCGGKKRGDVELHLPAGSVVIDFTVCNESAPSYKTKAPGQLEAEKDRKKQNHYRDGLGTKELTPFFLGTLGGWSNAAIGVVNDLVEFSTVTKQNAIRRITKEAMCRTGRMILRTRRCYAEETRTDEETNKENKSTLSKSNNTADPSPVGLCRIFSTDTPAASSKQTAKACRAPLKDISAQSKPKAAQEHAEPLFATPCRLEAQQNNAADDDSDEMRQLSNEAVNLTPTAVPFAGEEVERNDDPAPLIPPGVLTLNGVPRD